MQKAASNKKLIHPPVSDFKIQHAGLPAMLFIRNFNRSMDKHHTVLTEVEKDIMLIYDHALHVFAPYTSDGNNEQWELALYDIKAALKSMLELLRSALDKIGSKNTSDHSGLWEALDSRIIKMSKAFKKLYNEGKDQLSDKDQMKLSGDISHFDTILLPYIKSYIGMCKVELLIIERCSDIESDQLYKLIQSFVPDFNTQKEADRHTSEYLKAMESFKNALNNEKGLQVTFLDIMSQNPFILPEEKEMLHRWTEDQKSEI
jgi:hypothetical protein